MLLAISRIGEKSKEGRNELEFLAMLVDFPDGQLVELVELGLEDLLVRQEGLVIGDEGRRERAAEGIFHDFSVLGGAEQEADGGIFVGFADVAVEGFEVELQFAEVLGFEAVDLEFDGDEAVQATVEKEQIEGEVAVADLERILGAYEAEIAAHFADEIPELAQQALMEIGFRVVVGQIEEFEDVAVLENREGVRVDL